MLRALVCFIVAASASAYVLPTVGVSRSTVRMDTPGEPSLREPAPEPEQKKEKRGDKSLDSNRIDLWAQQLEFEKNAKKNGMYIHEHRW